MAEEPRHAVQILVGLTPAEREVALLAAQGHENQKIAETLCVSSSTVRTHLRSVFRKLGITTRFRLSALLRVDAEENA